MEYNFESMAEDLIIKFEKKLDSHRTTVENHLGLVLTALGDYLPREQRQQLEQVVSDMLNDSDNSHTAMFTQTMNKIVREIKNSLKGSS